MLLVKECRHEVRVIELRRCPGLTAEGLDSYRCQIQAGAKDNGKSKMAI